MIFSKLAAPVCGAIICTGFLVVAPHQAAAQRAAGSSSAERPAAAGSSDYWSVNTNLPSQYSAERPRQQPRSSSGQRPPAPSQGVTLETTSELGRVPVQGAAGSTIGFTSGSSTGSGRFADGRAVPGIDPNTRPESSFVGMSISSRTGFPIPAPTPWNRTE